MKPWTLVALVGCGGRIDGMDLGGPTPPLSDRGARGCTVALAVENNDDPEPDYLEVWTYDDRGQRVSATEDQYGDGTVDLELTTSFDDARRPTFTDGVPPDPASANYRNESWTYGDDGYLQRYTLDAVYVEYDLVLQAVADQTFVWEDDRVASITDADSALTTTYLWDEDGLVAEISSPSQDWTETWDEDGLLRSRVVAAQPGGFASRTEWRYDDDGRMVESSLDNDEDGDPDWVSTWTWTCD